MTAVLEEMYAIKNEEFLSIVSNADEGAATFSADDLIAKKYCREKEHKRLLEISKDKSCGICLENVMDKPAYPKEKFGILQNCEHVFCVSCIQRWRQRSTQEYNENRLTLSCPECRIKSDFFVKSSYWFDSILEKDKLITDYKTILSKRDCKYFRQGKCPLDRCYYKHVRKNNGLQKRTTRHRRDRRPAYSNIDFEFDIISFLIIQSTFEDENYFYSADESD